MPPYLPYPLELVYLSGVAEIGLGALLLVPSLSRLAGYGLILLLIAVFPANLNMAMNSDLFPGLPTWWCWGRLPLQVILGVGVWWSSKPNHAALNNFR